MNLAEFQIHNSHLDGAFPDLDPHLRRLRDQPLIHRFPLLDRLPRSEPGIYTIGGGRQIGKTTLLKQWMADLLATGLDPTRLRFFTGELIDDHHALVRLMSTLQQQMPTEGQRYILLDEVTYIAGWDKESNTSPTPACSKASCSLRPDRTWRSSRRHACAFPAAEDKRQPLTSISTP